MNSWIFYAYDRWVVMALNTHVRSVVRSFDDMMMHSKLLRTFLCNLKIASPKISHLSTTQGETQTRKRQTSGETEIKLRIYCDFLTLKFRLSEMTKRKIRANEHVSNFHRKTFHFALFVPCKFQKQTDRMCLCTSTKSIEWTYANE